MSAREAARSETTAPTMGRSFAASMTIPRTADWPLAVPDTKAKAAASLTNILAPRVRSRGATEGWQTLWRMDVTSGTGNDDNNGQAV